MTRWTGSATDRVLACPASLALPAVHDDGSNDADDGTVMHEYVYRCVTQGRDAALAWVAERRADLVPRCEAVDLSAIFTLGREVVGAEIALAYDVATGAGRVLGRNLGRNYGTLGEHEVPTTIDLVVRDDAGRVIVLDVKSGWRHVDARTSGQIRLHGLAFARAESLDAVTVGIVTIDGEGRVRVETEDLEDLDMTAFAARVWEGWSRVRETKRVVSLGRTPDVRTGEHCAYCPAYAACPARVAMARSVFAIEPVTVGAQIDLMSPEEAGVMWEKYKAAEKLLEAIGAGLKAYAEREPLPLPDGRELHMVEVTQARPVMAPTGETKLVTFKRPSARKAKGGRAA